MRKWVYSILSKKEFLTPSNNWNDLILTENISAPGHKTKPNYNHITIGVKIQSRGIETG